MTVKARMGIYGTTLNLSSPFLRAMSDDEAILSQALRMRFRTRRGALWRDPTYGFLIEEFVQDGIDPERLAQLKAEIEAECVADERVESADATVRLSREDGSIIVADVEIMVTPKRLEPFTFVLETSKLSGEFLRKGG